MRRIPTKREANSGVLKDGIYRLRIEDVEEKVSPNSGNEYLQLRLTVIVNGQAQGRSIWDVLSFSENSRFKFDQIFDALNAPEEGEVPVTWFKGKSLYATLSTDEYNGNLKNVVKMYLSPDVAKERLAKQAGEGSLSIDDEDDDDDEDEVQLTPVTKAAAKGKGRKRSQPNEFEDEGMPL